MADDPINHYKVVLLGEGRVGKTSLLLRYIDNAYVADRPSTMQASYLEKHVVLPDDDERDLASPRPRRPPRREARLSIWDTAGQERFHSLGPIYYRDAKGAVLVYDLTDRPSFERVRQWTKELRKMVGDGSRLCLTIVGNKADLARGGRAVETDEARAYAESVGAAHAEVSAKTGRGVEEVFVGLTKHMLETVAPSQQARSSLASASSKMSESIPRTVADDRVDLTNKAEKSKSSCC